MKKMINQYKTALLHEGRSHYKLAVILAIWVLVNLSFTGTAVAQVQLPAIPSSTQLSNSFEYDAEYVFRIMLDGSNYLEDGAIIAYADGRIRGAQTASVLFTPTNTMVYKIRLFSNSTSGEVITFKYYDINDNKIYDITETETFVADNVPDYYSPYTLNAYCSLPGTVGALIPDSNVVDLENSIKMYWEPASNATHYNLFLWKDGDPQPTTPYRSNIYGTSSYANGLEYGATYRWFVQSVNQCGDNTSVVYLFTVRELPDLIVTSVNIPDSVFSTNPFEVEFTVKNQGLGSTLSGKSWYNTIYISYDNQLSPDDIQIGRIVCNYVIKADSSYTQKVVATVPAGNAGNLNLFVKTDIYNSIPEADNNNNVNSQLHTLVVEAKPMPDILVENISSKESIYDPGDTITVNWDVRNAGGADAEGGWTEKVYLISLSGIRVNLSGTPGYSGVLKQDSSQQRSFDFIIPKMLGFSGEANIEVQLYPSLGLIENPGDDANNKASSTNSLLLNEKLYFTMPTNDISEGYTGNIRCYVSRSGNTISELNVSLSASLANQINIPASVIIPSRSSTGIFDITVNNNTILDGSRTVTLTASANGLTSLAKDITILDDEVPSLSITLLADTLQERDTVIITVSRDLTYSDSTIIYLATDRANQWTFPSSVTIPGNQNSVNVQLVVVDNVVPELDQTVKLMASSAGMTTSEVYAVIKDDDIPLIDLEIVNDTVAESAGSYATWGVIRRTDSGVGTIRVNLTVNVANAVYFPTSLTLVENEMSKKFNIGVVDNALVDGFRNIDISGSVYISSCGCNAPAESGGVVTRILTIIDNDGPALSLTVDQASLKEGLDNAGTLSVFRNTSLTSALEVTISVNDTSEIWLPAKVNIPAGEATLQIPIKTKDDGTEDGNQMVTIKAEAIDFSPGIKYVYVTDVNKPDLEMTDLELGEDSATTGSFVRVQSEIINNGFGTAPSGIKVKFYLSKNDVIDDNDSLIFETSLVDPISIGASVPFVEVLPMPDYTGTFKLLARVNPEYDVSELVYENNNASSGLLTILPSYTGVATTNQEVFNKAVPVIITGSAVMYDGSVAPNSDLDVYVITESLRREISVTTDDNGSYTATFEPFEYETGHYIIGACYPDQGLSDEQDAFDILGMERATKDYLVWNVKQTVPDTGIIEIRNRSNIPLKNVSVWSDKLPEGCELVIDTIDILPGGGTAQLHYVVTGIQTTPGINYVQFPMMATSAEGVSFEFTTYYYCQSLKGNIESFPASINTTMTKRKVRYYELSLNNNGIGETGELVIELPDLEFMSLVTPDTIDNLIPGDTAIVTMMLMAGNDVPLNLPFKGNLVAHVSNGDDLRIPFIIEAVSEDKGSLRVDVVDVYTYNTDSAPHVSGAHVVLRHPYSGKIIGEGFTDSTGVYQLDSIPEGNYILTVEADKHDGYRNPIIIDPGRTKNKSVFLDFQAITYTWDVIQTGIEDEYQVDLIMEFETNVPAPVVVMEMPDVMPQLLGDETYSFMVTLTNKGLITALDVELTFPQNDSEYEWVFNFPKMNLLAQQAVQIPVTMKRKDTSVQTPVAGEINLKSNENITSESNCRDYAITVYGFECGPDMKWHNTGELFTITGRVCSSTGTGTPFDYDFGPTDTGPGPASTGDDGFSLPDFHIPRLSTSTTECDPCLISTLTTVLGCAGGVPGVVLACIYSMLDGEFTVRDAVTSCVPGGTGCSIAIVNTIIECYDTYFGGDTPEGINIETTGYPFMTKSALATLAEASLDNLPPILRQAVVDIQHVINADSFAVEYYYEYFSPIDFRTKESFRDFLMEVDSVMDSKGIFDAQLVADIKTKMADTDIYDTEIDGFTTRWNATMEAWNQGIYSPTAEYADIIDHALIDEYAAGIDSMYQYALDRGFIDLSELYDNAYNTIKEYVISSRSSVCASVTIKISQKLVMTREAFEGTLTIYNGHDSIPMKDIKLNLEVRDFYGALRNDLFEIETKALDILTGIDSTGVLNSGEKGSATIIFIPEKGAAPTVPESYSFGGSFSYLDPFTNLTVTKHLMPVTLQVNPSPDLFLHYFMQRDILGDDALTHGVVEPSIPAELAVMIENNGYGEARNVRIESAQPEIVDNDKGLAIHFALIGSNLNGQERQMGLTNIEFGDIAPKSTSIGQWWFTSSLLGHFVDYKTEVSHLDSRGNPDLSLVSGAKLHELIRSIRIYGANDDGINDFLVNEIQDIKEQPDAIYLSQGSVVYDVYGADAFAFAGSIKFPDYTNTLTIVNSVRGWNYIELPDPGYGRYKIVSITRNSDGQVIPLDNAWLTFVTLPDGKEPVYENIFHFVDDFADAGTHEYTVVWKLKAGSAVRIVSIDGAPISVATQQVASINVRFGNEIDPATFTNEDMTLRLQGGENIMNSSVEITELDSVTYNIDLSALTTGNGYYVLNIETADIADPDGNLGSEGKQTSWTQFLTVPAVEEFVDVVPDSLYASPFDYILIRFNMPVDEYTILPERFNLQRNGIKVSSSLTITKMDVESQLFKVSGMSSLMGTDGKYTLVVDLINIANLEGEKGLVQQNVSWKMDSTPPTLLTFIPDSKSGFDGHHYSGFTIEFSEYVSRFDIDAVELWKDGVQQPLSQIHFEESGETTWFLSEFRLLTYYEGSYTLKVDMSNVFDDAGLPGLEVSEFKWTVDRSAPLQVQNLRVTPDLGYSDSDNITSTASLNAVMDVSDNDVSIEIYRNDFGVLTLLADTSNISVGELILPFTMTSTGNTTLEAHVVNSAGLYSVTQVQILVDQTAFSAEWQGVSGNTLTVHPDTLILKVSEKLLEISPDISLFKLEHNGIELPLTTVTVQQVSDLVYIVTGLNGLSAENGGYTFSIDLTGLHKSYSGLAGTHRASVTWTIDKSNDAPTAEAGNNFYIEAGHQYNLDGSGSTDPEDDNLTYHWFAPDGITLDDEYSVTPSFTAPSDLSSDEVYTFVLLVSDGDLTSTDKVNVFYSLATNEEFEITTDNIILYPNPCTTQFTVYTGETYIESIKLVDMSGATVLTKEWNGDSEQTIRIGALQKGVYIVQIKTDEKVINRKLLVK